MIWQRSKRSPFRQFFQRGRNNIPSPWGEGWGEGDRDVRIPKTISLKLPGAQKLRCSQVLPGTKCNQSRSALRLCYRSSSRVFVRRKTKSSALKSLKFQICDSSHDFAFPQLATFNLQLFPPHFVGCGSAAVRSFGALPNSTLPSSPCNHVTHVTYLTLNSALRILHSSVHTLLTASPRFVQILHWKMSGPTACFITITPINLRS